MFSSLTKSQLFIKSDGRFTYTQSEAEMFENVGDAWANCIKHGFEPVAKDSNGIFHEPNTSDLLFIESYLSYVR